MSRVTIGISGWGSVSPLGSTPEEVWRHYRHDDTLIRRGVGGVPLAPLAGSGEVRLSALRDASRSYRPLDRSVLLAMLAAEDACRMAGWPAGGEFGVNIGSSRGATGLWEDFHGAFLRDATAGLPPLASPTTTLGNVASWVAQHLAADGPAISHSITCSTALHALLNGVTWLEAGRGRRFLVGGSEAPLTPFTMAQMKALRIYTGGRGAYPCRAGDPGKTENTMVLGEGAACFCLERDPAAPLALIEGVGYGAERIATATSLSADGQCLQASMRRALAEAGDPEVDVIITHSPGTRQGDEAERAAIQAVFGNHPPATTNNKWKIGHTLGASGALSLELALLMLRHGQLIEVPYLRGVPAATARPVRRVLVNAAGFGGNAVSVVVGVGEK